MSVDAGFLGTRDLGQSLVLIVILLDNTRCLGQILGREG